MTHHSTRRNFLKTTAAATAALSMPSNLATAAEDKPLFDISIAQWSLHKALFAKKLDNVDFAKTAKEEFGINAIEYVNQFFKDKAKDTAYLDDLKKRGDDLGVKTLLIMIDGEGRLGDPDDAKR